MNKGFIFLGIILVALFLVGCVTQKSVQVAGGTGSASGEPTPLDSGMTTLDNSATDVNSVDSGLNDVNSDINNL